MNRSNRALDRLLRSAAAAPREEIEHAPYGFEHTVVARLRRHPRPDGPPFAQLFRQGLAWAGALMVVALALNYYHSQTSPNYEVDDTAAAWAIIAHE
jgi:hypothetical protein